MASLRREDVKSIRWSGTYTKHDATYWTVIHISDVMTVIRYRIHLLEADISCNPMKTTVAEYSSERCRLVKSKHRLRRALGLSRCIFDA
jgi:hypothetical protein